MPSGTFVHSRNIFIPDPLPFSTCCRFWQIGQGLHSSDQVRLVSLEQCGHRGPLETLLPLDKLGAGREKQEIVFDRTYRINRISSVARILGRDVRTSIGLGFGILDLGLEPLDLGL